MGVTYKTSSLRMGIASVIGCHVRVNTNRPADYNIWILYLYKESFTQLHTKN